MTYFLWVGLPYLAFTVLVGGTICRYLFFQRTWTTKSSQFLEKKKLRLWGPIFHASLFAVIAGHVVGVLIPEHFVSSAGVTEEMYHMGAVYGGGIAGAIFIMAFLMLGMRRFSNSRLTVNTSTMDKVIYALIFCAIISGFTATMLNVSGSFDYRQTIGPWFRSLLLASPEPSLMADVPFIFKIHMVSWMFVAIFFPFSRLVHCLSFPFRVKPMH